MKKFLALILVVSMLFCGCTGINQFLCSPNASQTQAADVMLSLAQAALTAATVLTGNAVIAGLSQFTIPVAQKIRQGYCVAQADWDNAVNALAAAQTVPVAKAAMGKVGVENPITYLNGVKW